MTVYIDVLLGVNLLVDYMLLSAVAAMHRVQVSLFRKLWGGGVMALSSLSILLPPFGAIGSLFWGAATALLGVWCTFGRMGPVTYLRLTVTLYAVTFAYGGVMVALSEWLHPDFLAVGNAAVYWDVSPLLLTATTLLFYGVLWVCRRCLRPHNGGESMIQLSLQTDKGTLAVSGKVDTGFTLTDPYSDRPLILLSPRLAEKTGYSPAFLLPCQTVQGSGLLEGFVVPIVTAKRGGRTANFSGVSVAVAKEDFDGPFGALVGNDFIERCEWDVQADPSKMDRVVAAVDRGSDRLHRRRHHTSPAADGGARKNSDRAAATRR